MRKKSQIKMTENIAVMVIFFVLLVFAIVFYANVKRGTSQDELEELKQLKAVDAALILSNLPEIKCSIAATEQGACLDLYKILALKEIYEQNPNSVINHYQDKFGFATITIRQLYPIEQTIIVYDNKIDDDKISKFFTPIPVTLYNVTNGNNAFGVIEFEKYA